MRFAPPFLFSSAICAFDKDNQRLAQTLGTLGQRGGGGIMDGENSQPCKHLPRPFCGALKQLPFLLGEMGRYGFEEMSRCPAGDKTKANF